MTSSRRYQRGQSAIIFAMLIVVIVGAIGLSVDGGNAYAEQRRVQSITNAGALAGMQAVQAPNATNQQVWNSVKRALYGNQVDVNGKLYDYRVDYVLANGGTQLVGEWNGETEKVESGSATRPNNIDRIQVTMTETVPTYFASVVGRKTINVAANGVACTGVYGPGVYPLGIPLAPIKGYHKVYKVDNSELPSTHADWGNWDKMKGMSLYMPIENSPSMPGSHFSWLNWGGTNGDDDEIRRGGGNGRGADRLKEALTYPGTLQSGFTEATPLDASKPNTAPFNQLTVGDWVNGNTGVIASTRDYLSELTTKERDLILPMYSDFGKDGGKLAFRVAKMGFFRLTGSELNGNPKYIKVKYLGDAAAIPTECSSEAPDIATTDCEGTACASPATETYPVKGTVQVDRVYRQMTPGSSAVTNDIVLVLDRSKSMEDDWNDRKPNERGYQSPRMTDAKKVLDDFMKYYDVSPATGDPDARVTLITFGGDRDNIAGRWDVSKTTWQRACNNVATQGCTDTEKWTTIRSTVSSITPSGLTPGAEAFELVETALNEATADKNARRRNVPTNKTYNQVVVFATDGVFNVCGNVPAPTGTPRTMQACKVPSGTRTANAGYVVPGDDWYQRLYNATYNAQPGRPIWQAQQVAQRIKNTGAEIFTIALTPTCLAGSQTCFDPKGLDVMSSGSGYHFAATNTETLNQVYAKIRGTIVDAKCAPMSKPQAAAGVKVTLKKVGDATYKQVATTDANGNFQFAQEVEAGQYEVESESITITSPESDDGYSRTYSRVINTRSPNDEGQVSLSFGSNDRNHAWQIADLLLSLPTDGEGTPHNACTMPEEQ